MRLELKNVSVKVGSFEAKDISFSVKSGEFAAILGPTGSGKSTILKTIAGLATPLSGEIFFGEKKINDLPCEKRNVGFVFQNSSLFPHLNVFENIAFGLKVRGEKKAQEKVEKILELTGLCGFEKRNVKTLSGGEERLVAIARSLVIDPAFLLLDEPLTGLDSRLREKLKLKIKEMQSKLKKTTVFVTHDIDEAFFLSDKIIVMNKGKIERQGPPQELFLNPKTMFVKDFLSDYALVNVKPKNKNTAEIETTQWKKEGLIIVKKSNFREKK